MRFRSIKPRLRPHVARVMQHPRLRQVNSRLEEKNAFPPAALRILGIYSADLGSRFHQLFSGMSVADRKLSYGPS